MKILSVLTAMFCSLLTACDQRTECTLEFRYIGVTITGEQLTDYYTIWQSNNDNLRFEDIGVFEYFYVVLDDNYQFHLVNKTEAFTFIGLINDQVVVNEEYIISADRCHINKVSGRDEIIL